QPFFQPCQADGPGYDAVCPSHVVHDRYRDREDQFTTDPTSGVATQHRAALLQTLLEVILVRKGNAYALGILEATNDAVSVKHGDPGELGKRFGDALHVIVAGCGVEAAHYRGRRDGMQRVLDTTDYPCHLK